MLTLTNAAGQLQASMDAGEAQDLLLSWPAAVSAVTWAVRGSALTVTPGPTAGAQARARLAAAAGAGGWVRVIATATLPGGEQAAQGVDIEIRASTPGCGEVSIFRDPGAAIAGFRRDRLLRALADHAPDLALSDDTIWGKLRSAEATLEKRLGVWLTPREVLPQSSGPVAGQMPEGWPTQAIERDPGYDYDPAAWRGPGWGFIKLRHRHVSRVRAVTLASPRLGSTLHEFPLDWIRLDGRLGLISLVPAGDAASLPLNAWLMSIVAAGRATPLMIQVRYRAGLEDAARDHPDVLDLVKRMAALSVLEDGFIPASGSVSADGLSQSVSWQAEQYHEAIAKKTAVLQDALAGPRMMGL